MIKRIAYFTADGTITKVMELNEASIEGNRRSDETYQEVAPSVEPGIHWIDRTKVMVKIPFPDLTVTHGQITGIPVGARLIWPDGDAQIIKGGIATFEAEASTVFYFTFEHPQFTTEILQVAYDVA
jgi:hypothetical protein